MRTKNFLIFLFSIIVTSLLLIIFGQQKPTIQNIVSTTHQQIRNFQDTLRDAEAKTFKADEKYLIKLGLSENARLYPKDIWHNTSLPVFVTYVLGGQESQAIGLISNLGRILPNNTVLVYNLGLRSYDLKTLLNYCNSSHCLVIPFNLNEFPSHIQEENFHAFRPLIIQDALQKTGSIFFLENNKRFHRSIKAKTILSLYEHVAQNEGILAWPMPLRNAVSSLTHKKMFDYFHTVAENFLFIQMVASDTLVIINTKEIHEKVLLPWVQCALTQDCIIPIGAQSGGCRFDKKPQYRYSGCHSYDTSALNIVLGLKSKSDSSRYTYNDTIVLFETVSLRDALMTLRSFEQNTTTEGRTQIDTSTI